jgi:hypothetical protein
MSCAQRQPVRLADLDEIATPHGFHRCDGFGIGIEAEYSVREAAIGATTFSVSSARAAHAGRGNEETLHASGPRGSNASCPRFTKGRL